MTHVCYKTSRDYKHLKELLDKGCEVVCFTTYDYNWCQEGKEGYHELMTTDVCYGQKYQDNYSFVARGIEYACYWPGMGRYRSFEEMCDKNKIEYIEPTIII